VRLLAPILSFTCEEVWRQTKLDSGSPESVHMAYFPQPEELTEGMSAELREQAADWQRLVPVRDQVLKALDNSREDRVIGSSLEATVYLKAGSELYPVLKKYAAQLPSWFIVSQVELQHDSSANLEINVERARGDKCERCWKFTTDVGSNPDFPTVCAACASVLSDL
jgi:isoleucyl-tRNA synthetase